MYYINITFYHLEFEIKPSLLECKVGGFRLFLKSEKLFFFKSLVADTSLAVVVYRCILLTDGNQPCCAASCLVFETTEALCFSVGSHCEQALKS